MKRVLVTGSNGQLGSELQKLSETFSSLSFEFVNKDVLNITNLEELKNYFKSSPYHFNAIINAAAYTNVEKAEEEKELAFAVNSVGVKNLAEVCEEWGLRLIHISTDYVFDGFKSKPYIEEDPKNPLSSYGKSKSQGEDLLIQTHSNSIILRTSWVYSYYGKNFFKTILNLASKQKEIRVVCDQIGTPTWAKSLAEVCIKLLDSSYVGILHYSNEGVASWYDFAYAIVKTLKLDCKVIPISSAEYPTKAKRPFFSVLDKSKFYKLFGYENLHWLDCVEKLSEEFKNQSI